MYYGQFRPNNLEVMGSGYIAVVADSLWMGDGPIDYLLIRYPKERLAGRV
jgi:hypothetical protein